MIRWWQCRRRTQSSTRATCGWSANCRARTAAAPGPASSATPTRGKGRASRQIVDADGLAVGHTATAWAATTCWEAQEGLAARSGGGSSTCTRKRHALRSPPAGNGPGACPRWSASQQTESQSALEKAPKDHPLTSLIRPRQESLLVTFMLPPFASKNFASRRWMKFSSSAGGGSSVGDPASFAMFCSKMDRVSDSSLPKIVRPSDFESSSKWDLALTTTPETSIPLIESVMGRPPSSLFWTNETIS